MDGIGAAKEIFRSDRQHHRQLHAKLRIRWCRLVDQLMVYTDSALKDMRLTWLVVSLVNWPSVKLLLSPCRVQAEDLLPARGLCFSNRHVHLGRRPNFSPLLAPCLSITMCPASLTLIRSHTHVLLSPCFLLSLPLPLFLPISLIEHLHAEAGPSVLPEPWRHW